jgi:hypothetical protein
MLSLANCGAGQDRRAGAGRPQINGLFLQSSPAEYKTGLDLALAKGWLEMCESGTYVKFIASGAPLFA